MIESSSSSSLKRKEDSPPTSKLRPTKRFRTGGDSGKTSRWVRRPKERKQTSCRRPAGSRQQQVPLAEPVSISFSDKRPLSPEICSHMLRFFLKHVLFTKQQISCPFDVLASQVTDEQSSSVGGSILSRSARNRSRLHSKRLKAVSSIKSLLDDLSGLFEVSEGADQTTEIRREIMFVFGRSPLSAKVVYKIFLDFRANPTQTQPLSLKTLNLYPRKLLRCLVGSTAEQACPNLRPTRLCVYVKGSREANFPNFLPKQRTTKNLEARTVL
eukprot:96973_1